MDEMNRDRRDQARWFVLLAIMAGAIYLCWLMLLPFIGVLLWASVLAIAFEPVHRRLLARTRRPELSAALSCLIIVLIIGVPLGLISWAVIHQLTPAISNLQAGLSNLLDPNSPLTGPTARWLNQYVDIENLRTQATEQLGEAGKWLAGRTLGIVGGVLTVLVQTLFVLFVMYYLFRDGKQVRDALSSVIPLRHRQTYELFVRTREVISASLYGVLVIAVIQGALGGVAFWALGLPSAIVWGVIMVFLSLIPVAGAFVVWVPAAIFLAVGGAWIKAIILTLWGSIVIGLVDNFLRPKLVGERAKLHELFIFFAVLGGLQVFGLLGIVIGPVVLAIALALFDALRMPKPAEQSASRLSLPPNLAAEAAHRYAGTAQSPADQKDSRLPPGPPPQTLDEKVGDPHSSRLSVPTDDST
jgi:predicted PurR-regulated permease PerM